MTIEEENVARARDIGGSPAGNGESETVLRGPRLWPIVGLGMLVVGTLFLPSWLGMADSVRFLTIAIGAMVELLLLGGWLVFASRLRAFERAWICMLGAAVLVISFLLQHARIGVSILLYGVPVAILALAAAVILTSRMDWQRRRWVLLLVWSVPILSWLLLRSEGYMASFVPQLRWRWTLDNEASTERLVRENVGVEDCKCNLPNSVELRSGDWPRFRGPVNDGQAILGDFDFRNRSIQAKEVWRKPAGPSWGSVIVVGGYLYTIEQRGDDEVIVCLDEASGKHIWESRHAARYIDPTQVSGVGPRGTPVFHKGMIYSVGALGHISALRANDGSVVWERDLIKDSRGSVPQWGLSTSPIFDGDRCLIMSSSESGGAVDVICYDALTGDILWMGDDAGSTYSSLQLAQIDGVMQLLMFSSARSGDATGQRIVSRATEDGALLWRYQGKGMGNAMAMPLVIDGSRVIDFDGNEGAIALQISKRSQDGKPEWIADRQWNQNRMLVEFSDGIVQDGMLIGLSKGLLTAVDLTTGKLLWKKLRLGGGQLIGLAPQGMVLTMSEQGVLSLAHVSKGGAEVVTEWQALEGKTWAHPILVGTRVYCRNAEQVACYELFNLDVSPL